MLIWKKFKFGVFDVDGTLFDNMQVSADAFFQTTANYKLPKNEVRKIYLETNGMNLDDQFKLVFNKYGIKYDDLLAKNLNKKFFNLRDNSPEWKNSPLFDGIESFFKTLHKNGIKNFISSGSNTDEIISRLKKARVLEYFDLVLGGDKIPKSQKHIDHFAKFCGLTPQNFASEAFFISDGPNDMTLAKNAGIFAIGIANTVSAAKLKSAGANLVILNINDLKNLQI